MQANDFILVGLMPPPRCKVKWLIDANESNCLCSTGKLGVLVRGFDSHLFSATGGVGVAVGSELNGVLHKAQIHGFWSQKSGSRPTTGPRPEFCEVSGPTAGRQATCRKAVHFSSGRQADVCILHGKLYILSGRHPGRQMSFLDIPRIWQNGKRSDLNYVRCFFCIFQGAIRTC